jgi:PhnB protein
MIAPRPQGHAAVMPFLMGERMDKLIEFMTKILGAEELYRLTHANGKVWHAQLRIGDAIVMAGDTMGMHPPAQMNLYVYVDDVDAMFKKAIEAGAESIAEPEMQFYGDRAGGFRDFAGNVWWLANHREDVSYDEMTRRAKEIEKK